MKKLEDTIVDLSQQIKALLSKQTLAEECQMPGSTYVLQDNHVLCLPRDDGDSRYPYGQNGFNFWAYASGYMHANDGLFSLFLRAKEGQEPTVAFFAGWPGETNNEVSQFLPMSLLPVPVCGQDEEIGVKRFSVLSPKAAYYLTECRGVTFGVRVFVSTTNTIHFSLLALNQSKQVQKLFLSSYLNPYLREQIYESDEDRWFKEIALEAGGQSQDKQATFLIKVNEDIDRFTSITNYGVLRRQLTPLGNVALTNQEVTTSRNQYVGGSRSSLHCARSLARGTFGESAKKVTTFVETAIAGELFHLELSEGAGMRIDFALCMADSDTEAASFAGQPIDPAAVDRELEALVVSDQKQHRNLAVEMQGKPSLGLKPKVFNAFFEHLKRQVEFCSLIKGYVQLSPNSLIGIRDVFQAIEGFIFWQPEPARAKMLEALDYTSPDGRCYRQYSLPSKNGTVGNMDLRAFIDQGVWVISTVFTYIQLTGDTRFLMESCGYHEIVDEAARLVSRTAETDTVLDHLVKIMDYLLRQRDMGHTGCVRALYGDWNDALDGLGITEDPNQEYGTGVSVMATLQAYQNTREMAELLELLDAKQYADRIADYRRAGEEIAQGLQEFAIVKNSEGDEHILHGWGDRRSYLVGGFNEPDAAAGEAKVRDSATGNAFWVLSNLYHAENAQRSETILKAFERLSSRYGIKTFEPFFPANAPGVGRIGKLPPGTAENGAPYIHASLFAIMAYFKMGQPRKGWEQLAKVLPFSNTHYSVSHSPFVMPNSYGENPEKGIDGESMNDWQTGSSNVLLKVLMRYVYGFECTLRGIWIQPAGYFPFDSFDFSINARDCSFLIYYQKSPDVEQRSFKLNGQQRTGERDKFLGIDRLWLPYSELKSGETYTLEIVDIDHEMDSKEKASSLVGAERQSEQHLAS